jgi:hypothetical protein
MMQPLFWTLVALTGYAWLTALRVPSRALAAAGAFPAGVLAWLGCFLVSAVVHGGPRLALALQAAALAAGLAAAHRRTAAGRRPWADAAALAVAVAGVSYAAQRLGYFEGSFDSFELIALGKALALIGFRGDVNLILASWGVLIPALQGAGALWRAEYVTAVYPLFYANLLGLVAYGVVVGAGGRRNAAAAALVALAAVALVASTYFVVFQAAYVHNSLPSAVFLLLAFAAVLTAQARGSAEALVLGFVALVGFTFCRTEAPLSAVLFLLVAGHLVLDSPLGTVFRRLAVAYAAVVVTWYTALALLIGSGSDILTPGRAAVQAGAVVGLTGWLWLGRRRPELDKLFTHAPLVLLAGAAALLAGGAAWKGSHLATNAAHVLNNMLFTGRWGVSWAAAFVLAGACLAAPASRLRNGTLAFALAFGALVLSLGLFRDPFRLGWGDSANRIFTHLLPLLVTGAAASLLRAPEAERRPPRIGAGTLTVAVALGAALGLVWALAPANVGPAARVAAAGFCGPDPEGRHDFAAALSDDPESSYAAACEAGPRSVVLTFARPVALLGVDAVEYAPSESWTDFAVAYQDAGGAWVEWYDTRKPSLAAAFERVEPARFRVAAPPGTAAAALRIDFRAASGQNRLLLRRMRVFARRGGDLP